MNWSRVLALLLVTWSLTTAQIPKPSSTSPPSAAEQQTGRENDQDIIKINTNLVQIDAVVTKSGKQVTDLTASDFEISEDGKPQSITSFTYVSSVASTAQRKSQSNDPIVPVPLQLHSGETRRTIAIVIDDLGMTAQAVYRARNQLRKFVNEQLNDTDLVAILRTSGEIGALQQFVTDRRVLLSAIDHVKWQPCSRAGADVFDYNDRPCSASSYGESLRALRYIISGMASLPGRKSLLLLSDNVPLDRQENGLSPESPPLLPPSSGGAAVLVTVPKIDTGGTTNRGSGEASDVRTSYEIQVQHIAELAIRSSVVIYTVDTRGIAVTFPTAADTFKGMAGEIARQIGPTMSARSRMLYDDLAGAEVMAKETGGFMISNSNDFGLKDVYEDSQGYYLIGFRPREETFDEKFHHISVKVKRDGFTVRTRKGFYGVTDDVAHAAMQKSPNTITEALRSPFGASQMTVRLNSLFTDTNDAGPLLRISIYVNARDLSFTESADGAHEAGFEVGSILFGDNGEVIYLRNQTATLHLNASQYERTLREGVLYGFDVPLKYFGAGQFRIAVRDRASGHLGTAGQVVILPDLRRKSLAMSGIILSTDKINKAATIDDLGNVPAVRRFRQGDKLLFAYAVYKARLKNGKPQLTTQTRLFHDGKLFFTGNATALSTFGQNDFARIIGGSRLQLGKEFPTGDYVLQIVITDNLGKEKEQMTTQWIDFEVVK